MRGHACARVWPGNSIRLNLDEIHALAGGYLWSPKRTANGARNPFYESIREVSHGDIIFSFVETRVAAIGLPIQLLSCHRFRSNKVRLWLSLIAYNLGNLWRRLALPNRIGNWSLTSLQQRLVKTGGRLVKHARYYWLLLA